MIKSEFTENNDENSIFYYIPQFLSKNEQINIKKYLNTMNDFHPCHNYQKYSSRSQKWYHNEGKYFCPKWKYRYKRWESFEYDDFLKTIQEKVQRTITNLNFDVNFNSCLINKYNDGNDYIHSHRDSPDSFGEYPVIVGLSFGSPRKINFTRTTYDPNNIKSLKLQKNNYRNFSYTLESGSMFIMAGSSQKYFAHEIPQTNTTNIRYSLTFRQYIL
jgi:alkylated DNA repair dioxygenase AlkB